MKRRNISFLPSVLITIELALLLLSPEVLEARGRRVYYGGDSLWGLWWIPALAIYWVVKTVEPKFWKILAEIITWIFISLLGSMLLANMEIIEKDSILIASPFVFIAIFSALYLWEKVKHIKRLSQSYALDMYHYVHKIYIKAIITLQSYIT